uniref:Uncharacterized protein n=1 Tax=Panagrolaimus sp. PS1159 TaxID=55785 RepID=A0AC35GN70_9BILA
MGEFKCSQSFTYECHSPHCCESYHQRFIFLIFTGCCLVMALIIIAIWIILALRPSNRATAARIVQKRRSTAAEISEIELKSNEEAKYLRRMSEINPNVKHQQYV